MNEMTQKYFNMQHDHECIPVSYQHVSNLYLHPHGQTCSYLSVRHCVLQCMCLVISCVHKADDEQQFGDAVQSKTSGKVMVFWTLVSRLRGSCHMFDPLNHLLICWRGNRAEGLVQMLAAHVRERPLLPPHRGVLHHFRLRRQPVGLY